MNKFYKFFLALLMILTSSSATNNHLFIEVASIQEAEPYLLKNSSGTLIIFDIDSTLTTPTDAYLRRQAIQRHKHIYQHYVLPLTKNQKRIFNHLLVLQSPSQLVEEGVPILIRKIQDLGLKTLAFTASKIGPVGEVVPSFPEWRYKELQRLGINFSSTYPGKVLFQDLPDFGGDITGMEKGIVYCGHQVKKGDLLKHVLQQLKHIPEKIIFIDDKRENLESLALALKKDFPSITYLGIHYKGMDSLPTIKTEEAIFTQKIKSLVEQTKKITLQDSTALSSYKTLVKGKRKSPPPFPH